MKKIIQIIKSIRVKQILTVFLAGSLLIISTACSKGNIVQTGDEVTKTTKKVMSDTYDDYDANQPVKGGMNGYNDDPRYNAETAAKTKALIDTAKSRQQDNLEDYVEGITDRAGDEIEEAKKDIPRTLEDKKEDTVEYVDNKSDKLKDNLSNTAERAQKILDEATQTAQDTVEEATSATETTAQELKNNLADLS
ncbi:MAG: hypothetical protein QNJ53_28465 [Pleurocapsa sp. MO_192.B19]|nr:hypothetical protein [Pleurocapsa sp. MO_192.B19]